MGLNFTPVAGKYFNVPRCKRKKTDNLPSFSLENTLDFQKKAVALKTATIVPIQFCFGVLGKSILQFTELKKVSARTHPH